MRELRQIEIEMLQEQFDAATSAFNIAEEAYNIKEEAYNIAKEAYNIAKEVQYHARIALARAARSAYYEAKKSEEEAFRDYSWAKHDGADTDKLSELRNRAEKWAAKLSSSAKLYDIHCAYAPPNGG